jgi:formate dehydrogenase gamma subunit
VRLAMMIDLTECIGCLACVASCKERWDSGPGARRNWVRTFEHGRRGADLGITLYPGLCMQCEAHPCTTDCPTGATYRNDRGIVVVDPDVCIGCGNCISMCPYGARTLDQERGIVEKCNLCEPYVLRGESPACVATCLSACRHFGDLDDPASELVRQIRERGAKALVTPEVDVAPKVTFAGAAQRERILASGAVRAPRKSWLTLTWTGASRPFARTLVPLGALGAISGGLLLNLIARRRDTPRTHPTLEGSSAAAPVRDELLRHRLGMRALHWFNAASWLVLLLTGTALMSAESFALFGTSFPRWVAGRFSGTPSLIRFHVVFGLAWGAVIVPLFLLYKRGGREAWQETRLRADDLRWLVQKPLAMLGRARGPLPPQDKYNAGQKVFALTAVVGTATILLSGVVMSFHWGSATTVSAAILVHKASIALALLGLAVHLTMAAIVREERPALRSMITGRVERDHALRHNARWTRGAEQAEGEAGQPGGKES